jgi:hypothetical protein
MKVNVLLIFIVFTFAASCDCLTVINGIVISAETGEPISNAEVVLVNQDEFVKTDSNGVFSIGKHTGFCFTPELLISKDGLKKFNFMIEHYKGDTKYVVRSDWEYINLDKPYYPDPNNPNWKVLRYSRNKNSQDFSVFSDTIHFFLETDDLEKEIELLYN